MWIAAVWERSLHRGRLRGMMPGVKVGVLASTAALVVLLAGCSSGTSSSPTDGSEGPRTAKVTTRGFAVPTYEYRAGTVVKLPAFRGELMFGPNWCPYLGGPGDLGLPLAFPQGFEAQLAVDGKRVILDDHGAIWAREGDHLTIGLGGTGQEALHSRGCTSGRKTQVNPVYVAAKVTIDRQ